MDADRYDTLIIGAGAAGLAAARRLHDAGQHILVLEAQNRVGGRIHTDYNFADFPVELGAEFIHGENALTHELVREAGFSTIPVVRMDNLWWAEQGQRALPREQWSEDVRWKIDTLTERYHALGSATLEQDCSLWEYFRRLGTTSKLAHDMADVLFAQTCCASIDTLSAADLAREMRADRAGKQEFRIREGYGKLLEWYSRDLPIRLNTPVDLIRWNQDGVTVGAGEQTFEARRCVITLPVSVLAGGSVRFDPALSDNKNYAIHSFRTEAATKLIYRFREPLWDDRLTYMAHTGMAARWWTPGYGRDGAAVICCYVTAGRAEQLDGYPGSLAHAYGLDELSVLLGLPETRLRENLLAAQRVSWATDPSARGGYAHVPPGHADARPLLAAPEGDVLFFAGEATAYDSNPQTVHGALESGLRAAGEVLAGG